MSRAVVPLFASLVVACSPANVGGPSDAGSSTADTGGGHDTGSPAEAGTEAGTSVTQACTDYASARCARIQSCSPTAMQTHYGDVGTCVSLLIQSCLNGAAAPSTGTTVAELETCVSHVSAWGCHDIIVNKNPPSQCITPPGGLATGAACAFPQQCQSAFCAIVPGAACGVCATAPAAGAPCANLTNCGQDLSCTSANTCEPYAATGGACNGVFPCSPGLTCVGASGATKGTCQTSATTAGAGCGSSGPSCDVWAGLACNSASLQCAPLVLGGNGDQCGYVNLQNSACLDGLCAGIVGSMPGTCVQYPAIGGSCDLVSGPSCFVPVRCVAAGDGGTAGTCQIADATMCH